MYQYVNSDRIKGKKIQYISTELAIFLLIFTLIAGSVTSNLNAYGQSNETDSQSDSAVQILSDNPPPPGENEESTDQLISETASTSGSNIKNEEQNTLNEINPAEEGTSDSQPDGDCLFDPSLPKCAPDENGNCPEGFAMNEDGQCFPRGGCPEDYHAVDDDESGRCIPNSEGCPSGMIFRPDMKTCGYKDDLCRTYPNLAGCKVDDAGNGGSNTLAYNSGYTHGCSDAKISDSSKRYIYQPGKGPNYHTPEFMSGYTDGFEICSNGSNPQPSNTIGTFKVIVEVTNQSPRDTYGGITVNVGNYPENIFKSANDIYFPAGQTVSKEFTFKSSDVPVGTGFEVNVDYGDDYSQYIFGENTPAKKAERVHFIIS
ncbi:MAG: hypothetical protein L0H55_15365 [Candidatus Nitrosocosmicus sp.]|nr:hypothetical protein [Candidatus Nitrosocosmicus sp.]